LAKSDIPEPFDNPVTEQRLIETEMIYGWLIDKDSRYTHFYDIDFMIEIG